MKREGKPAPPAPVWKQSQINRWRDLCEWLEKQKRKAAYQDAFPRRLRPLVYRGGNAPGARAREMREQGHLIFYSSGWGWRLRLGWRDRLDDIARASGLMPYASVQLEERVKFRIYPLAKGGLYFDCFVFPSRPELHEFFHSEWAGHEPEDYEACFCAFDLITVKPEKNRRKMIFGAMGFYIGNLRQESISHEAGHAAASYMRRAQLSRRGIDFSTLNRSDKPGRASSDEEMLCLLIGRIAKALSNKFHALGFYG